VPKTGLFWVYIDVFKAKNANIEIIEINLDGFIFTLAWQVVTSEAQNKSLKNSRKTYYYM
jgi:hypothetical protein